MVAKYCVLDGDLVHVIPDSLSYEQAALTEPAAVAVYAVRQSALKAGDTAVIFGLGPPGLFDRWSPSQQEHQKSMRWIVPERRL